MNNFFTCKVFRTINPAGYTQEQYRIWLDFKEVVEQILEVALSSVGGSIESLEKALDEIAHIPARGPKDDAVKGVLQKLLSVERWELIIVYCI
jgi:hypothetical protein